MLKRLTRKVAHKLAVTMFSVLELLGLPRFDPDRTRSERHG